MQQHHAAGDEDLDVCHLFLPEGIVSELRDRAGNQSVPLHDLVKEQAERLLIEPSFFDAALGLADALWERLARGHSEPFPWPADPLLCVGGTLVFAADLEIQVQKDLLARDDVTVNLLGTLAADRAVSYRHLVNETVGRCWNTGLRVKVPNLFGDGAVDRRGSGYERHPASGEMIARLDFTVKHEAPGPDLPGARAGKPTQTAER